MTPRRRLAAVLLLLSGLAGPVGLRAEDPVPRYRLDPSATPEQPDAAQRALFDRAVSTLLAPPSPDDAADAVRLLAGAGPVAAQHATQALDRATWPARATLITALGEMDFPGVTPVLVAATTDASFVVREAAVRGLGKTGDARSVDALAQRVDSATEGVWTVRAGTGLALRRGILRGAFDPARAEALLLALLQDGDRDVRIAALDAVGPLALASAEPLLLDTYSDDTVPREERTLALAALRHYRDASDELVAALRAGFVDQNDENAEEEQLAVDAGRALFEIRGAGVLQEAEVGNAALQRLMGSSSSRMRYALGRAGPDAAVWLDEQARYLARRHAAGRTQYEHAVLEALVDALIEVDRPRAGELLADWIGGPEAGVLAFETRRFALAKAELGFAAGLGPQLRALYDSGAAQGLEADLLRAIVQSGGDDLAARIDAALAHELVRVRRRGLELLRRRDDIPHGAGLRALATGDGPVSLRADALEVLAAREPEVAFEEALLQLDSVQSSVRRNAVAVLSGSRQPAHFDRLLAELERTAPGATGSGTADDPDSDESDDGWKPQQGHDPGRDPVPGAGDSEPDRAGGPVTASSPDRLSQRERLRRELLGAIQLVGGDRARPYLLRVASSGERPSLRTVALGGLREIARTEDAAIIEALLAPETTPDVADLALRVLARLPDAPEAKRVFTERVASRKDRASALRVLRDEGTALLPVGLAAGLLDPQWEDGEREAALALLERAGQVPPVETLIAVAAAAHGPELSREALRQLQAHGGDVARKYLQELVIRFAKDTEKLAFVIEQLGRVGDPEAVPGLVAVLDAHRRAALDAHAGTAAAVRVYRDCAIALGRCGGDEAGRTLVRHLLDPDVVRAGARYSVEGNGPFFPPKAPVPEVVRSLVHGFLRLEPERCERLLREALDAREARGELLVLDEEYVDGVARYLHDPAAYRLPRRRRPRAGLLLRRLVPRIAPRLSTNDREAWSTIASELESDGLFEAALAARREHLALSDVEYAERDRETRLWDAARLHVTQARGLAAAGRQDEALAVLTQLRALEPASAEVAYLQGYGLVKIGGPVEQAGAALRDALLRDIDMAGAHFYLAWVVQSTEGPGAAVRHYEEALRRDTRRVHLASTEYLRTRHGLAHPWSHYPYWLARAFALSGDEWSARSLLVQAVLHDDRDADRARGDDVFKSWEDLEPLLAETLDRIPD